ncbi:MAG TPA: hypothetical protein V6C50_06550 [Crinalium sp.]
MFEETINDRLTNVIWADTIAVALPCVTSVGSTRLFRFFWGAAEYKTSLMSAQRL